MAGDVAKLNVQEDQIGKLLARRNYGGNAGIHSMDSEPRTLSTPRYWARSGSGRLPRQALDPQKEGAANGHMRRTTRLGISMDGPAL